MPRIGSRTHPPQILVASHHAGPGAELQQLAERHGYTVLRTYTGTQTLERVRTARPRPDVIILDDTLPDLESYDASRALRDDPAVGPGAPILLLTAGHPAAAEHAAALRAGVWEFLSHPFNAEEVVTKLHSYVLLKLDADRVRQENAIEDETGFNTVRGLALRAQELTLQAFHHGAALACVALAPVAPDAAPETAGAAQLVARVLHATHRRSDAIGRLGPG
ncbi:MAG: response regulator, partial [Gemmatimonadales bacterium]